MTRSWLVETGAVLSVAATIFVACGNQEPPGVTQAPRTEIEKPSDDPFPDPGEPGHDGGLMGPGSQGDGSSEHLNGDAACAASAARAENPPVDIIFAVDTSGSMDNEILKVKANINTFAKSIGGSGLDYQVIMVAAKGTETLQICVAPPLAAANCEDNPPRFHHVNLTVDSHNALVQLLASYDTAWKQFVRHDSYKVFIVITDDEARTVTSADFEKLLFAKLPTDTFGSAAKRKYIFDSIVGWTEGTALLSPTKCGASGDVVTIGEHYQHLSQLTGGTVDSICKGDWSSIFDHLAKGIVTRLGCELVVPKPTAGADVDPKKVEVQYTPSTGPAAGKTQLLTPVTDKSKCGQFTDGWYYDDPVNPTKILLCDGECKTVGDNGGKLEMLLGCRARVPQ